MNWLPQELDGMFVGQFKPCEYEHFLESGELRIVYEGMAGLLGLGKFRYSTPMDEEPSCT